MSMHDPDADLEACPKPRSRPCPSLGPQSLHSPAQAIIASTEHRTSAAHAGNCFSGRSLSAACPAPRSATEAGHPSEGALNLASRAADEGTARAHAGSRRSQSVRLPEERSKLDDWAHHPLCGAFSAVRPLRTGAQLTDGPSGRSRTVRSHILNAVATGCAHRSWVRLKMVGDACMRQDSRQARSHALEL